MGVLYTVHVVSAAPSPTTMTHLETTDPEATTNEVLSDEQYYKELLHNQEKELKGLKCVPVQGSVDIKSQLKSHDSLLDMQFFPQVAAVNRCHQECSFCGDHQFGIPRGSCVPESERKKTVIVFYLDGGHQKYRRVMLTEHTSCKCS
ncbi:hypothetical protein Pcinc_027476 [Petrolisthes cinctipes]|uniref:Platelet-derived growth factor (PDGF) family profile domain-containing protein n=1 Tax=Petrolisthes cinctipes TaxID=88211 RepID=A0AAE1F525_PETCI|nr:hypothetical protein Pcinc_027476 [Petrolisthes cinctipes]